MQVITVNNIVVDSNCYLVFVDQEPKVLARKEFELIRLLATYADQVITRKMIFSEIWEDNLHIGERTIDVHIRKIRQKTGIKNIRTVKGVGYILERELH